jgi:hypothetical protein
VWFFFYQVTDKAWEPKGYRRSARRREFYRHQRAAPAALHTHAAQRVLESVRGWDRDRWGAALRDRDAAAELGRRPAPLRLFPVWAGGDAQFHKLRGAFLVSVRRMDDAVLDWTVESEAGEPCTFLSPWPGRPSVAVRGANVPLIAKGRGEWTFAIWAGSTASSLRELARSTCCCRLLLKM